MSANSTNDAGKFQIGRTDGNCLEAWSPPETVENAHDRGTPQRYEAPLNSNAQHLPRAPSANR